MLSFIDIRIKSYYKVVIFPKKMNVEMSVILSLPQFVTRRHADRMALQYKASHVKICDLFTVSFNKQPNKL